MKWDCRYKSKYWVNERCIQSCVFCLCYFVYCCWLCSGRAESTRKGFQQRGHSPTPAPRYITVCNGELKHWVGTFRSDYDYKYEYDFWAREGWVLAVVDTVVAVVSSQQKYFSNFCEHEVVTFCQSRECLVDKQHKMPQRRQTISRQVAQNISQCIWAFKD